MSNRKNTGSRLVYSTDGGRLCPQCLRTVVLCVCGSDKPVATGDGIVRLHRETKGRGGKAVTLIKGLPLAGDALKSLASQLKKKCGVGGALKEDTIEIQGDSGAYNPTLGNRRRFPATLMKDWDTFILRDKQDETEAGHYRRIRTRIFPPARPPLQSL